MMISRDARFVLEWLAKEDESALGECRGPALDELTAARFAIVRPAGIDRVVVTAAGHAYLAGFTAGREDAARPAPTVPEESEETPGDAFLDRFAKSLDRLNGTLDRVSAGLDKIADDLRSGRIEPRDDRARPPVSVFERIYRKAEAEAAAGGNGPEPGRFVPSALVDMPRYRADEVAREDREDDEPHPSLDGTWVRWDDVVKLFRPEDPS